MSSILKKCSKYTIKYYKVRLLIWTYEYIEHIFMPYSELFKTVIM